MQNIKTKKRQKTARLVLAMVALSLLPLGAFAQEGLFQRGVSDESFLGAGNAKDQSGFLGQRSVGATGTINNQTFGQPVPVGSGMLILLAAGTGYAALKRKEEEK